MKKPDEMEIAINFKAMRCAFTFVEVGLLTYSLITFAVSQEMPFIPFTFAIASSLVFWVMKLYYTKKMTTGNGDEE